MVRTLPAFVSVLLAALLVACSQTPVRPHASLGPHADPLRSDFNRDAGRVRIVMVPAPT